jgi:hypothetical protein
LRREINYNQNRRRSRIMPKVSEGKVGESLMCLFKGEPKSGKKYAWASFPEPVYCLDTDGRMASIISNPLLNKRDIEYDTYTDYGSYYAKLEELQKGCRYKTVVGHSITSLARLIQDWMFANRGKGQEISEVADTKKEKVPLMIGKIPIMGIAEYNGESSALSQCLTKYRIIRNVHKVNVVLVAHVIITETQTLANVTRTSRRILTGGNKIASEIPGYFDEVYHFEYKLEGLSETGGKFVAHTKATGTDFAGTSLQNIPEEIDFTDKLFYEELSKHFPKKGVL